jgi:hypothetical protein
MSNTLQTTGDKGSSDLLQGCSGEKYPSSLLIYDE